MRQGTHDVHVGVDFPYTFEAIVSEGACLIVMESCLHLN